ncbi:hypothetical protein P4S64_07390 [Vibrio sp. M60_M31a]
MACDVMITVNLPSVILLDESGKQPTVGVSTPGAEYADLRAGVTVGYSWQRDSPSTNARLALLSWVKA